MRRVAVKQLQVANFRSFRQPTVVDFGGAVGLRFLCGANDVEPRLGANGAGKSSIWEAVTCCLYGCGIKGRRLSSFVAWGAETVKLRLLLLIDNAEVAIERQGPPNKVLVDGQPRAQAEVDALLGLSRERFIHSVIFGQAVPLFPDLSVADRGTLLDEVLDLKLWLTASDLASTHVLARGEDIAEADRQHAYIRGQLAALPQEAALQAKAAAWQAEQEARLEGALRDAEAAEARVNEWADKLAKAQAALRAWPPKADADVAPLYQQRSQIDAAIGSWSYKVGQAEEDYGFFETADNCPICRQPIDDNFAKAQCDAASHAIAEARRQLGELQEQRAALNSQIAERQQRTLDAGAHHQRLQLAVNQAATHLDNADRAYDASLARAELLAERGDNPYDAELADLRKRRQLLEEQSRQCDEQKALLSAARARAQFWQKGFKRVRLYIIRKLLAHLELEVANAASVLGLPGWRISFATEQETKSGTLRPGVHISVSKPQGQSGAWEDWSGGETQRIRLAVAIGLGAVIQRLAGLSYDLEVWDEPSAWLSPEGIEDLLECLKWRAEAHGKQVWLCDHRALAYSGFSQVLEVRKDAQGSHLRLLSQEE